MKKIAIAILSVALALPMLASAQTVVKTPEVAKLEVVKQTPAKKAQAKKKAAQAKFKAKKAEAKAKSAVVPK